MHDQCEQIGHLIVTNNPKTAFQLVKTLTKQRQGKVNTIQEEDEKCPQSSLTGEDKPERKDGQITPLEVIELFTFQSKCYTSVICHEPTEGEEFQILSQEVESTMRTLEFGNTAGVDNVPDGQPVVDVLVAISNKIWDMGKVVHHHS